MNRTRLYKLLAIGRRQLGMDEETYRAFLAAQGATAIDGRISAKSMTPAQLHSAVEAMKSKGFRPTPPAKSASNTPGWRKARIDKITALWCALADAGVVQHRDEAAMVKWCATITRKARLQWASSQDLNKCVEGLKAWGTREGVHVEK